MNVLNIALPGYDAETDTNPDHFSLKTDEDDVLIKEFTRGSKSLASGASFTITHNLGYIPFFIAFTYDTFIVNGSPVTGYIQCSSGGGITVPVYVGYATTTTAVITNNSGNTITFWYYLFYDKQL